MPFPAEIKEALAAYQGGESALSIQGRMGISHHRFYRYLHRQKAVKLKCPRKRPKGQPREKRNCPQCGIDITAKPYKTIHCSIRCGNLTVGQRRLACLEKRFCKWCNGDMTGSPNLKFCSKACYDEFQADPYLMRKRQLPLPFDEPI